MVPQGNALSASASRGLRTASKPKAALSPRDYGVNIECRFVQPQNSSRSSISLGTLGFAGIIAPASPVKAAPCTTEKSLDLFIDPTDRIALTPNC